MASEVDLRQLAVRREAAPPGEPGRRRIWLLRYGLPALLLAGFCTLAGVAARDVLWPPRQVTVIPVLSARAASTTAPADSPLFQAAGWVEPRPTPFFVTAQIEGVVEKLLVTEGQQVQAGQEVARLYPGPARLAVRTARADLELRSAEVARAEQTLKAAQEKARFPVHLKAELADAEAALARVSQELALLPYQIQASELRARLLTEDLEAKRKIDLPPATLRKARGDAELAALAVEELKKKAKTLPEEAAALKEKRDALRERLQRKIEESRQLAEAEADLKAALARRTQARVALDTARWRLNMTRVRAPVSGRVLHLFARPGLKLGAAHPGSTQDSTAILSLYDPACLQARVDVRLDDVGKVRPGMKVRVTSAALPGVTLAGEVLFATSQADVQKNTLAVKVLLANPPATLKPDMLVQATFLASPVSPSANKAPASRLWIPRQLIEGGSWVWVADQSRSRALRRSVQTGVVEGELVEVLSGLETTDRLIVAGRDGLKEGQRIRVVGEDESLGLRP